jgi:hypothetical protein
MGLEPTGNETPRGFLTLNFFPASAAYLSFRFCFSLRPADFSFSLPPLLPDSFLLKALLPF